MATARSTNFFILFWQGSQVLSGHFIKRNLANSSGHLVKYNSWRKTVYILSRYTSVGTKLAQVALLEAVLSDIS